MTDQTGILEVKQDQETYLLNLPNVVGVGVGYAVRGGETTDELCVVVLVRRKLPEAALSLETLVPAAVAGVPTDVVEVGELVALQARTDRWRPAPGGVSLGHFRITAGTFGAVVRDRTSGERLILSNNHVLANSNDAQIGDPILQPGPADGGRQPDDTLAHLLRFIPIAYNSSPPVCSTAVTAAEIANGIARLLGSKHRLQAIRLDPQAVNQVDAALARPISDGDILDEIVDIGTVNDTTAAVLGMAVRKSGRTTSFTTGTITTLNATVDVSYGSSGTARFENQIVSGPMSQGGDSGSLLVAADSLEAVGLLYAGSNQTTIYNPIESVLDLLGVEF